MTDTKRRAPVSASSRDANRLARRQRRRDQAREEILAAARRVLMRDGLAATTLGAVAREMGVSKTALYYYYPSKDALFFDLMFRVLKVHAQSVHDAVEKTDDGAEALRAVLCEGFNAFAHRIDDFRVAFLHGQVAGKGAVHLDAQQFAHIRPLNDLWFAGAARRISADRKKRPARARVEPRLLAFLAHLGVIGLLTMKGLVESMNDPLKYSDEQIIEAFARVFEAAAAP